MYVQSVHNAATELILWDCRTFNLAALHQCEFPFNVIIRPLFSWKAGVRVMLWKSAVHYTFIICRQRGWSVEQLTSANSFILWTRTAKYTLMFKGAIQPLNPSQCDHIKKQTILISLIARRTSVEAPFFVYYLSACECCKQSMVTYHILFIGYFVVCIPLFSGPHLYRAMQR